MVTFDSLAPFDRLLTTLPNALKVSIYYILPILIIDTRKKLNLFLIVHLGCIIFLGFQGILQDRYDIHLAGQKMMVWGGDRITWIGNLADSNQMAVLFIFALPFFMAVVSDNSKWSFEYVAIACILGLLMLYDLKLCNSRGGYLAAIIAIMSFLLLRYRMTGVLLALGVAVAFFVLRPGRTGNIGPAETSALGRLIAWQRAMDMVEAYPFFGTGQGTFLLYHFRVAHNTFLQTMAQLGFFGLFFYIGLYYIAFKKTFLLYWHREKILANDKMQTLIIGYGASFIGVTASYFFISQGNPLLFMWLAMPIVFSNILTDEGHLNRESSQ